MNKRIKLPPLPMKRSFKVHPAPQKAVQFEEPPPPPQNPAPVLDRQDRKSIINESLKKLENWQHRLFHADLTPADDELLHRLPFWKKIVEFTKRFIFTTFIQLQTFSTPPRRRWNLVVLIAILYNSSILPFRAAFGEVFYSTADATTVGFLIFLDYLCDAIYLLDIFVQFRTSFYHKGLLVDNTKEVTKRYAKGYFSLDLMASLPLEVFVLVWKWKDPSLFTAQGMSLLRFNRILRLVRYFVYFEFWARYSKFPNAVRIVKLCIAVFMLIHWIACGYYRISYYSGFGSNDFVPGIEYADAHPSTLYLFSVLWAASTLTGLNDNNEPPVEDYEKLFCLLVIFLGILVAAAVIGDVGALINNMNANAQSFRQKMDILNLFMANRKVPVQLRQRIQNYYDHLWSRQQGLDDAEILNDLPHHLKTAVALYLNADIISNVPLFQDSVPGFIPSMSVHLKSQIYSPNEVIFHIGDIGREMYFINKGTVDIISRDGKLLASLSDGAYFGEIALLFQGRRTATVVAKTYCDLFVLTKKDLEHVLKIFPEQKEIIERMAKNRLDGDKIRDMLRAVPFFQECNNDFINSLATRMRVVNFPKGDYIIKKGETGTEMYFLIKGECSVELEEGKEPVKLTHGAFFGETAILHEVEREAAVVCDTDVEVLVLTKDAVEMVLIQHPGQQHFIQELSESGSTSKLQMKKGQIEKESGDHGKSEEKQESKSEVICSSSSQYLQMLKKLQQEEINLEFSNEEISEMLDILTEMTTVTALKKTS